MSFSCKALQSLIRPFDRWHVKVSLDQIRAIEPISHIEGNDEPWDLKLALVEEKERLFALPIATSVIPDES